jgi:hypothetical protein
MIEQDTLNKRGFLERQKLFIAPSTSAQEVVHVDFQSVETKVRNPEYSPGGLEQTPDRKRQLQPQAEMNQCKMRQCRYMLKPMAG